VHSASGAAGGVGQVWDLRSGAVVATILHALPVDGRGVLAVDGTTVLVADREHTVRCVQTPAQ